MLKFDDFMKELGICVVLYTVALFVSLQLHLVYKLCLYKLKPLVCDELLTISLIRICKTF